MAIRSDAAGLEKSYLLDMLAEKVGCILEIGCGDGRLIGKIASSASRIVGIDLPATLPSAQPGAGANNVSFAAASGVQLPFREASFEGAIFGLSF